MNLLRNAIIAVSVLGGLAGCAPARPAVVEREEVYDYDGYHHTVVVEEAPPPAVVVVGPPVYYGGGYYGPRYRHWR